MPMMQNINFITRTDKSKRIACIEMNTKKDGSEGKVHKVGRLAQMKYIASSIQFFILRVHSVRKTTLTITQIMKDKIQIEVGDLKLRLHLDRIISLALGLQIIKIKILRVSTKKKKKRK